jgi:hypothetical protein
MSLYRFFPERRGSVKFYFIYSLIILMLPLGFSCSGNAEKRKDSSSGYISKAIVKKRDDGTLSSVNQIGENGYVHGIRETYYSDGKTKHSRIAINHGIKHGPSIKYYKNGQIFHQTNYVNGKKHGPAIKYYKNGGILAEIEYEDDKPLPGLKEFDEDGKLISSYPDVKFREIDLLESKSRIDLEISCSSKRSRMKFFILNQEDGKTSRVYLITEKGAASLQYYVMPGEKLNKEINVLAEIPTDLGNVLVKELSYHLTATNTY